MKSVSRSKNLVRTLTPTQVNTIHCNLVKLLQIKSNKLQPNYQFQGLHQNCLQNWEIQIFKLVNYQQSQEFCYEKSESVSNSLKGLSLLSYYKNHYFLIPLDTNLQLHQLVFLVDHIHLNPKYKGLHSLKAQRCVSFHKRQRLLLLLNLTPLLVNFVLGSLHVLIALVTPLPKCKPPPSESRLVNETLHKQCQLSYNQKGLIQVSLDLH